MPEKRFVSIIWGYHAQFFGFSKVQNYQIGPLIQAANAGYSVEAFMIEERADIAQDPHFDPRIQVTRYKNPLQMLLFLWKHRKSTIYANSVIWQNLFLVPLLCRRAVFMAHDSIARRSQLKQIIQDRALSLYWRIRVISPEENDFLVKRGFPPEKVFVVPIALDISLFKMRENNQKPNHRLVYLGNVTPDNDPETILRAFSLVRQAYPGATLDIIGEVRMPQFTEWISKYNLQENIVIHGYIPHEKLATILPEFSIFVNSVVSSGQHLAVFEAALCGLALCMPKSMQFSVFGDAALFHDIGDAEMLGTNIKKYLSNPELATGSNQRARSIIKDQYNESIINEKIVSLFELPA